MNAPNKFESLLTIMREQIGSGHVYAASTGIGAQLYRVDIVSGEVHYLHFFGITLQTGKIQLRELTETENVVLLETFNERHSPEEWIDAIGCQEVSGKTGDPRAFFNIIVPIFFNTQIDDKAKDKDIKKAYKAFQIEHDPKEDYDSVESDSIESVFMEQARSASIIFLEGEGKFRYDIRKIVWNLPNSTLRDHALRALERPENFKTMYINTDEESMLHPDNVRRALDMSVLAPHLSRPQIEAYVSSYKQETIN